MTALSTLLRARFSNSFWCSPQSFKSWFPSIIERSFTKKQFPKIYRIYLFVMLISTKKIFTLNKTQSASFFKCISKKIRHAFQHKMPLVLVVSLKKNLYSNFSGTHHNEQQKILGCLLYLFKRTRVIFGRWIEKWNPFFSHTFTFLFISTSYLWQIYINFFK